MELRIQKNTFHPHQKKQNLNHKPYHWNPVKKNICTKSEREKEWEEIGDKVEEKVRTGIKNWIKETEEDEKDWEEIGKKVEEKIKRELRDWAEKYSDNIKLDLFNVEMDSHEMFLNVSAANLETCGKCGTQFAMTLHECPKCKAKRM